MNAGWIRNERFSSCNAGLHFHMMILVSEFPQYHFKFLFEINTLVCRLGFIKCDVHQTFQQQVKVIDLNTDHIIIFPYGFIRTLKCNEMREAKNGSEW